MKAARRPRPPLPRAAPARFRWASVVAAVASALLGARDGWAQGVVSRFSVRAEVGAGSMLPTLQREALGYDSAQAQFTGRVGFDVLDWLSLQVSMNHGVFVASEQQAVGRTLALQVGLRLQPAVRALGRAWADINPGYYSTGADRVFGLDAGLGFEFNLARAVALGPFARVHWLRADTAVHEASDATYLSVGVSLTLRVPPRAAPVVLDRDRDGVRDDGDLCPSVPQGARYDPARRGCPLPDAVVERVVVVEDRDRDGVIDAEDLCLTTPTGPTPDPARRGCPVEDRDHDGIADGADGCPDQAETFNDRDDADGCPEVTAPSTRAGGRIRVSEQIVFRADTAEIRGRRSFVVIDAIANIMRASPDIVLVHVEGHTDDPGDADHNRALSNQRAEAVVRALIAHGIAASRLTANGYGRDRPVVTGGSHRARAANRRIEFRADLDGSAPSAAPALTPATPSAAP